MRCLLLAFLLLFGSVHAASNGKGKGPAFAAPTPTPPGHTGGSHGGSGRMRYDPRQAPPLSAERKVVEQDCTKPVDFSAGNLRCK